MLVSLINEAYLLKKGVFKIVDNLLEFQIPKAIEYGSIEHARFYFYLIFNDHGTKSIRLYEKFKNLYDNHNHIFIPTKVIKEYADREELFREKFMLNQGLRYPTQASKSWIENSKLLVESYGGEPINLFQSTNNAVELFKRIRKFRSYGPKTSGLLLRVILGVGFNRKLKNIKDVPLPVDIHDSRIAFICGIYNPSGVENINEIYSSPKHIKNISILWKEAAEDIEVKWEEIDRALWLLGSIGCVNKFCLECPINEFCQVGKEILRNEINLFNYSALQHR